MRAWSSDRPQFCVESVERAVRQGRTGRAHGRATCCAAIAEKSGGTWHYEVKNFNRSIGARLSGEIARHWGNYGMSEAPLTCI